MQFIGHKKTIRNISYFSLFGLLLGSCVSSSLIFPSVLHAPVGYTFTKNGEYLVGVGDQFELKIQHEQNVNSALIVNHSGQIDVPIAGFVFVAGKTEMECRQEIERSLARFIKRPQFQLNLLKMNSFKIHVAGEVVRPGILQLGERTTLLKAIAEAGGPTKFARGMVSLFRGAPGQVIQKYVIDYDDLLSGSPGPAGFLVERNDYIHLE